MSAGRHVGRVRHPLVTALFLLVWAPGCSSSSSEPGACLRAHENACVAYDAKVAAAGKRMCAGMKWEKSCPTADRLGTCVKKDGTSELVYAGAPNNYSPVTAGSACAYAGGAFTAEAPR